jgi:predicted nucleic acid-binding protein
LNSIQLQAEAYAVQEIQGMILSGEPELGWSYVLSYEISRIKNIDTKNKLAQWEFCAHVNVDETDNIKRIAKQIQLTGVKEKDALHVACAITAGCHFFVTTDQRLLKYQDTRIKICDPIECLNILRKIV